MWGERKPTSNGRTTGYNIKHGVVNDGVWVRFAVVVLPEGTPIERVLSGLVHT